MAAADDSFRLCGAPTSKLWKAGELEAILTQLRTLANVDYLGHVSPEQTVKVIGDASLLLSMSEISQRFLGGLGAGTPVVSLQIDPDYKIRNYELGKVGNTVEGAVDAVRCLMTSSERRQDMGMRARRHGEEVHSPVAAVRAFESAVASVFT